MLVYQRVTLLNFCIWLLKWHAAARLLKLFGGLLCVSARTSTIFLRQSVGKDGFFRRVQHGSMWFNVVQCGSMTIP